MLLYRQGKVPGSFYDGFGQEAVSAGPAWAMHGHDRLCILHRDLAAHIIRGVPPARILGQYMGREGGITGGRDGNVHFGDRTRRLRRDGLDAARHDARRDRARDGVQDARRAARGADVVRRRLDVARRLPRGDELGRRAEAAGHLHPREQPVRVLHADDGAVRGRPGRARGGVRLPGHERRRQRRRGDVRGDAPGARARDRRRGPDDDRGRDDAHARPRRARRHEVRAGRADRGVEAQGPDRPPGQAARAARRRRRRAARRGQGRDRRAPPRRRWRCRCPTARPRRSGCSPTSRRCSRTARRAGAGSDGDDDLPAGDLRRDARGDARRRARLRDGRGHRRLRRRVQGDRRVHRGVRRRSA